MQYFNNILTISGVISYTVYVEEGSNSCLSFTQAAQINTGRNVKRDGSVLGIQFTGSKEVGITFLTAWSRPFTIPTNDTYISVCIVNVTKTDAGIFSYHLGLTVIENITLLLASM